ncbi:hypothetical protein B0T22DRAFT_489713 [Podospora appendiculata]|uniref:Aflatoxin regulatory protein domain-containing protein n=1 Tax=Podospora appendiculata TaxID=314037 RepID=A0AAE0X884_9PEZI|nr:hypothetical protein B0T22DRAFT_489713 [Podospora appendiculata]
MDPALWNPGHRPHLSSHSTCTDAEYTFFGVGDTGSHDKSGEQHDGSDSHLFNEALSDSSTDFNVDHLAGLWSTSSTEGGMQYLVMPHGVPTPPRSASHTSMVPGTMTGLSGGPSPVLSRCDAIPPSELQRPGGNSSSRCSRQCLYTITLLLEEIEQRMHSMRPPRLEGVLSWQKEACQKCIQVLHCQNCYASSEHMMLLIMFCDKLIMLTQKLLWHTADESGFHGSIPMRDYEINDPNEMVACIRFLSGHCVKKIAQLLAGVKMSPAVEGKQVQLMMVRNIELQVAKTLNAVQEHIAEFVNF